MIQMFKCIREILDACSQVLIRKIRKIKDSLVEPSTSVDLDINVRTTAKVDSIGQGIGSFIQSFIVQ